MPDWKYNAWRDEDNLALVRQMRPQDVEEYIKFPSGAIKSDVARYLYMYQFGGVYFDTDFRFFKPITESLLSHACILGIEEEVSVDFGGGPKIGNAFIGSQPGLTLWSELVDSIFQKFRENEGDAYAWQLSGPYALTEFLRNHKEHTEMITILPRDLLYPKLINFNLTGARYPETIGVHLCWSSWREMSRPHKFKNRVRRIMSALA
jgi:mannosyltransferase OCH1-like enzyme